MSVASEQMVSQQVRTWDVLDPEVLEAMRRVPRERFVPAAWQSYCHAEFAAPLAHGKRMLTPSVVGRVLQALLPKPGELALEIGTGSGYLSACLAYQGAVVHSLEIHADLAAQAQANLTAAQARGVTVEVADGTCLSDSGKYDCIVLTASLPQPDERYARALKPGGRLFMVQGTAGFMQALRVLRTGQGLQTEILFQTSLEPLENAPSPSSFHF